MDVTSYLIYKIGVFIEISADLVERSKLPEEKSDARNVSLENSTSCPTMHRSFQLLHPEIYFVIINILVYRVCTQTLTYLHCANLPLSSLGKKCLFP